MDILQLLPIEQWSVLRNTLRREWPMYSYYYYLINNTIKWKKKDPAFKFQIFCPNGDVNSGVFVAISTQSLRLIFLFAFEESKELLGRVLKESTVINWNQINTVPDVHTDFDEVFEDFIRHHANDKNLMVHRKMMYNYFKSKEQCLESEVIIPEECELTPLDESHIPFIHSVWPHRSEEEPEKTTELLASMVRLNRGLGLFLKEDGSLLSWVLHNGWGGVGMLQTVEEHKRKGYGKIIANAMSKQLAEEEDLDSFVFIEDTNVPSIKLFESLEYKFVTTTAYYTVEPKRDCR